MTRPTRFAKADDSEFLESLIAGNIDDPNNQPDPDYFRVGGAGRHPDPTRIKWPAKGTPGPGYRPLDVPLKKAQLIDRYDPYGPWRNPNERDFRPYNPMPGPDQNLEIPEFEGGRMEDGFEGSGPWASLPGGEVAQTAGVWDEHILPWFKGLFYAEPAPGTPLDVKGNSDAVKKNTDKYLKDWGPYFKLLGKDPEGNRAQTPSFVVPGNLRRTSGHALEGINNATPGISPLEKELKIRGLFPTGVELPRV